MKSQRKIPMKDRKVIYRKYENGCLVYLTDTYQPGIVEIIPRSIAEDEVCRGISRYVDVPDDWFK